MLPHLWDRGVGRRLLEATLEKFDAWATRHVGLFTFPHSPKHIGLYQRYGFWPRNLTAVMRKRVEPTGAAYDPLLLSVLSADQRRECIDGCFAVSDSIYPGLDLGLEIRAVLAQGIGDTVLLVDGSRIDAFAVCHSGTGAEAESGACYVKFAASRSGAGADGRFAKLLDACQNFAAARGATSLVAGVNTGRHRAYRAMLRGGFRAEIYGIAMHRPDEPATNREDVFAIDDWR